MGYSHTLLCLIVKLGGARVPVAAGFTGDGFILIPGVLHAYKASAADLAAGYLAPAPEPQSYVPLRVGLGVAGWKVPRRRPS